MFLIYNLQVLIEAKRFSSDPETLILSLTVKVLQNTVKHLYRL